MASEPLSLEDLMLNTNSCIDIQHISYVFCSGYVNLTKVNDIEMQVNRSAFATLYK